MNDARDAETDWQAVPTFGTRPAPPATCIVRPSAYAIVSNGPRIAVVRTREGVFLPGGGIDRGETVAECVRREAREECGLTIRLGAWALHAIAIVTSVAEAATFEKRSTFVSATVDGPPGAASEPFHELVWIEREAVAAEMGEASHRWAVEQWLADRP